MNEITVKRAGNWLRLLGSLPNAYAAVLLALPFAAAGLGWFLSLPIQWVGLATIFVLGVSLGLGFYLGRRWSAASCSSPVQTVAAASSAELHRTAVKTSGRASVELLNSPISGHDIAVNACDDSKVRLRDSPIK